MIRNLFGGSKCRTIDVCDIFGDNSGKALYRLDGNANDESGNYHGTETAITYGGGVYERGAVFNGTTSQIVVPNITSVLKSISFYARKNVSTTQYAIYGGADESWFGFGATDGVMRISINGAGGIDLSMLSSAVINTVYHFVLVWDTATSVKLYRDGVLQSTTTVGGYQTTAITYLGRRNSALWFSGMLDQVRIFNRALTATEVATLYAECEPTSTVDNINPFEDGSLKALYQFNGDATDKTGVYNGTATNVTYGTGKFGQAVSFTGTTSVVTLSNTLLTTNASFNIWAKFTAINTTRIIFSDSTNASGFAGYLKLYINTSNNIILMRGNNSSSETILVNVNVPQVVANSFNMFTVTITGTLAVVFIDGKEIGRGSLVGTTGSALYIGNAGTALTYAVAGSVYDQLRIFNKALTPMEVASLYCETTPLEEKMSSLVDPFKDGSGQALYRLDGNALDESGNYNGTATSVTYGTGRFGRAGVFNGSAYIVNNSYGLNPTSSYSISLWFKTTASNGNGSIISLGTGLQIKDGASEINFLPNSTVYTNSVKILKSRMDLSSYVHLVLSCDGSGIVTAYLNGTSYNDGIAVNVSNATSGRLAIGVRGSDLAGAFLVGNLDQIRIFNRALTASEVQTLYTEI